MNGGKIVLVMTIAVIGFGLIGLVGCKKKEQPAPPQPKTQQADKVAAEAEQTICPVMGGKINKNIFTEYKGKKVYFCCAGCKETFEKDPEKYIAKLPQFAK
ncbi:MAG: YHS domain-containing protein [Sedimentisphaerales bacterium]